MKQDWKKVRLGEVAEFQRGLTYGKEDESQAQSSKIVLRSNNIDLQTNSLNFEELKYLNEDFEIPQEKCLKKNSIFICMSNGSKAHIGKVAYIEEDFPYAFGGFMGLILPKSEIDGKYLYYVLTSDLFRSFLVKISNGINITNLKFSDLKNFEIPLPPLATQTRIVHQLDLLTRLTTLKAQQLTHLHHLAHSTFHHLFVEGNPQNRHSEQSEESAEQILRSSLPQDAAPSRHCEAGATPAVAISNPSSWPVKTVGDIVSSVTYGTSKPAKVGGKYKYLRMGNIDDLGYLDFTDMKYIDIDDSEYEKYVVRRGDILFNRTNSREKVGKTALFDCDEEMIIAGYIIRVRLTDEVDPVYFARYMNMPFMKDYLRNMCRGIVGQANINSKELQSIPIVVPPIQLQKTFAQQITRLHRLATTIQTTQTHLHHLLQTTLHQYFG